MAAAIPVVIGALKVVGTIMAVKSVVEGLKEGNIGQAILGAVGAYAGISGMSALAGAAGQTGSAATGAGVNAAVDAAATAPLAANTAGTGAGFAQSLFDVSGDLVNAGVEQSISGVGANIAGGLGGVNEIGFMGGATENIAAGADLMPESIADLQSQQEAATMQPEAVAEAPPESPMQESLQEKTFNNQGYAPTEMSTDNPLSMEFDGLRGMMDSASPFQAAPESAMANMGETVKDGLSGLGEKVKSFPEWLKEYGPLMQIAGRALSAQQQKVMYDKYLKRMDEQRERIGNTPPVHSVFGPRRRPATTKQQTAVA